MELANPPSLPDAHQQIRLGDNQASAQKWTRAIEYYLRAIEYFQAIQKTLHDDSLIAILQAQIVQCEKTIQFYGLKDRSEQAIKAAQFSKLTRTQSVSNIQPTTKKLRMNRHNTMQLENTNEFGVRGDGGLDSLAALMFPNHHKPSSEGTKKMPSPMMVKKTKNDSQKMEELQTSNEALKNHLSAALEDIERLKSENKELRVHKEVIISQPKIQFGLLSANEENSNAEQDAEESENELEDTI